MKITFGRYSRKKVSESFHISNVSNLFQNSAQLIDCSLSSLNFSLRKKGDRPSEITKLLAEKE